MLTALVLGCGLLGAAPAAPSETDLQLYKEAKAQAKRDPAAHVRLALWCEAHGLPAQQLKHLAIAIVADPQNATARGLLGLVSYRGQWQKPDDVAAKIQGDEQLAATLAEYNARRDKAANTADAQSELALWCARKGLKAEAMAHMAAVTRLDPSREGAWKFLGCKKHKGRWMNDEQIAADNAETAAQKKADHYWKPLLEKWRESLGRKDRRAQAVERLAQVTDPRAVPSVWLIFGLGTPDEQLVAVQVLGQIGGQGASRSLAMLAAFSPSANVRTRAAETLGGRDPREFVGLLISFMRDPLKYEVKPVGGAGEPGVLFVEGERYNVKRVYTWPSLPNRTLEMIAQRMNGVFIPIDGDRTRPTANSVQLQAMTASLYGVASPETSAQIERDRQITRDVSEAQKAAASAQMQLQNDVASIENYNAFVTHANENSLVVLNRFKDTELGTDRNAWSAWWTDRQGYAFEAPPQTTDKPTVSQLVFSNYTPSYARPHNACFGAGTLVRTLEGTQPIETLKVGDQILTQDTTTGALRFEPIMQVFHNRPAATLKVTLGDETIIATGIHRFWRAGKGWAMARELKPGDTVRTLGGLAKVTEVTENDVRPVFNLEVASGRSYFVGQQGTLVHDNSLVEPVAKPFDAEPELVAAKPNAGGPAD